MIEYEKLYDYVFEILKKKIRMRITLHHMKINRDYQIDTHYLHDNEFDFSYNRRLSNYSRLFRDSHRLRFHATAR